MGRVIRHPGGFLLAPGQNLSVSKGPGADRVVYPVGCSGGLADLGVEFHILETPMGF